MNKIAYLIECLDCGRDVISGNRCPHCDAPLRMIDRVNESLKRAHERSVEDHAIKPVIVRKGV